MGSGGGIYLNIPKYKQLQFLHFLLPSQPTPPIYHHPSPVPPQATRGLALGTGGCARRVARDGGTLLHAVARRTHAFQDPDVIGMVYALGCR